MFVQISYVVFSWLFYLLDQLSKLFKGYKNGTVAIEKK